LRNKIHKYEDLDLVFTYHPEHLIINNALKANAWSDFKLIKNIYINEK
jgi:uracil-DNA glycosylase